MPSRLVGCLISGLLSTVIAILNFVGFVRRRGTAVPAVTWVSAGTPLATAIISNDMETLQSLLTSGCDPNSAVLIPTFDGKANAVLDYSRVSRSALHVAIESGNVDMVELLVEHGADVNLLDATGSTPLHHAVGGGSLSVLHFLLRSGANPRPEGVNTESPLLPAANAGTTEAAKLLIQYGADINSQGYDGETPLMLAIEGNHLELAQYLLQEGADVHKCDSRGRTALWEARRNRNRDAIKLLVDHGA